MARLPWRKDKVFAVEARPGVWAVGQMAHDPYVAFFDFFCKAPAAAARADPAGLGVLFCCAVTRGFFSRSNAVRLDVPPRTPLALPTEWLDPLDGPMREAVLWAGTRSERRLWVFDGLRLVREDVVRRPDRLTELIPAVAPGDAATVDAHELTSVRSEGELNERLYLCYKLGRNVDPLKDLILGRPIPRAYARYVDAIAS